MPAVTYSSLNAPWQGLFISENGKIKYTITFSNPGNKTIDGIWQYTESTPSWVNLLEGTTTGDKPPGDIYYGVTATIDGSVLRVVNYGNGNIYNYDNATRAWTILADIQNKTFVDRLDQKTYTIGSATYPSVAVLNNTAYGFLGFGTVASDPTNYPLIFITNDNGNTFKGCFLAAASTDPTVISAWGLKLNNNGTRAFYLMTDSENLYSIGKSVVGMALYFLNPATSQYGWYDVSVIVGTTENGVIDFAINGDGTNVVAIRNILAPSITTYHYTDGTPFGTWASATTINAPAGTTYHACTMNSDGTLCYVAYKDSTTTGVLVYTMNPSGVLTLLQTIPMAFIDYNATDDKNPYVTMTCSYHNGRYLAVTDFGTENPLGGNGRVYIYTDPTVPCLTEGTRVKTPTGYTQIQDLHEGDVIVTDSNECVRIRGIRKTEVPVTSTRDAPFHIPADSIQSGLPLNDIRLSPDHLIHIGGDRWLTSRQAAKRNPSLIQQYGVGLPMTYYAVAVTDYFKQNLVIEDGVVVEAYASRGLVWDEDAKAFERVEKNENID